MRNIFLILLCTGAVTSLHAQFNVGLQGSYMNNFTNENTGHFGFGIRGEVGLSQEFAIQGGVNYFFPSDYSHEFEAIAYVSTTTPNVIPILGNSKLSYTNYYIGAKYYLKGSHSTFKKNSETAVYIAGGVGVLAGGFETTANLTNNISRDLYEVPVKDTQLGAFTYLTFNPSIGVEKLFGSIYLYSEFKAYLKVYEASRSGVDFPIPYVFNLNVGMRFGFGADY